jgi:hypothetical protein
MKDLTDMKRRDTLMVGMAACAVLLSGCGGGASEQPPPTSASNVWAISSLLFTVGGGATVDLSSTLPLDVKRGGTFMVDPSGSPLPSGMTLSPAGILAVGTAAAGVVNGVVFGYDEP